MLEEIGFAPNADLPIALLYKIIGIPQELNTPIFMASRYFGWVAHMVEQRESNSPLWRPVQIYTGPSIDQLKTYIPIEKRK